MPKSFLEIYNEILQERKTLQIIFKPSNIIWGAALCAVFIVLFLVGIFFGDYPQKFVFVFLTYISLHYLIFNKMRHLSQHKKGKAGLTITDEGLFNNTGDTEVFIPWKEIINFQYGYRRTNRQIFINVTDPEKYEKLARNAYLTWFHRVGKFFRTKPHILWIDAEDLNIPQERLIALLPGLLIESKRIT